jgi:hypothetical protein
MGHLENFVDDFGLLVETGFIAVKQGDEVSALKLFSAAQLLKPEDTAPQVGLGWIAFNKVELTQATTIFNAVLAKEDNNHLAKVFLGLCLMMSKSDPVRGEALLNEVKAQAEDPAIINFAETALGWKKEYFEKEAKTPIENN